MPLKPHTVHRCLLLMLTCCADLCAARRDAGDYMGAHGRPPDHLACSVAGWLGLPWSGAAQPRQVLAPTHPARWHLPQPRGRSAESPQLPANWRAAAIGHEGTVEAADDVHLGGSTFGRKTVCSAPAGHWHPNPWLPRRRQGRYDDRGRPGNPPVRIFAGGGLLSAGLALDWPRRSVAVALGFVAAA